MRPVPLTCARTFDDERTDAVHGFHFAEVEHAVFDEVGAGVLVVRRQAKPDRHVDQLIGTHWPYLYVMMRGTRM